VTDKNNKWIDGLVNRGIVYSTESGRMCPECGRPVDSCTCDASNANRAGDGIVRVRREVKGRKGKTVTSIDGLCLRDDELSRLAARLKKKCGTGGSVKEGIVLIQGDHRETVVSLLEQEGFTVKLAGG
jgi:translation initiation factor 1